MIGSSNDETNFQHKLLLTDTQVSKIRKAFANGSSANIKSSKTHLPKIVQSGGFVFAPPNIFDSGISKPFVAPVKGFVSLANSIAKESKDMGAKKINNDIFVDAGLSLLGKKIKKGISAIMGSGITQQMK